MRKFILGLIVLLTVLFVISRIAEMQELAAVLRRANPGLLALAVLAQMLWFPCAAQSYRVIYARLGLRESFADMLRLTTAATFIGVLTPSGGMSALAVFLANARRRVHPVGRVLVGSILYLLCEYLVLLSLVAISAAILLRRDLLQGVEVLAAVLLGLLTLALFLVLALGARAPRGLERLLTGAARLGNRLLRGIRRRPPFDEEGARRMARDLSNGSATLGGGWRTLFPPFAFGTMGRLLQAIILALIFPAFGLTVDAGTLLAAYGISQLFVIISPTPAGVGIVEGAMTVVLRSLGLRLEAAAVVALTFRAVTFWIPFAIGFFAFQHFSHRPAGRRVADLIEAPEAES